MTLKCPNCGNEFDFNIKDKYVTCDKCGHNGEGKEFAEKSG